MATSSRSLTTMAPVAERAANLVRCCIAHGTTAIRTHVDVDPELGLSHVHALAEVRQRFAG
ncbi:MAG: metal-dependent hydrolase, partial [Nitrospinota bacterium]|nr:metal-dependent hydrolase [Nitrospinota bacterium]